MEIPETLQQRIDLYRSHGRVFREGNELFTKVSWLQVMHGQRIRAESYHPLADVLPDSEIDRYLNEVAGVIDACADYMPTHAQFVADHCAASKKM
jgi:tryptophan halogenase